MFPWFPALMWTFYSIMGSDTALIKGGQQHLVTLFCPIGYSQPIQRLQMLADFQKALDLKVLSL
jgi:hypothetical protein